MFLVLLAVLLKKLTQHQNILPAAILAQAGVAAARVLVHVPVLVVHAPVLVEADK